MGHRIPESEFRGRPWRIHEFMGGFRVEDVWAVDAEGDADDFSRVVDMIVSYDTEHAASPAVRFLFAARWKLGEWLGWDDAEDGLGRRVGSLRAELPDELRQTVQGSRFAALPFTALYELDDEFAAEVANKTMHGVMHLGAVPASGGRMTVQMTVLVKVNGLFGRAYMAAIRPFRYVLVYPAMFRELENRWTRESAARRP